MYYNIGRVKFYVAILVDVDMISELVLKKTFLHSFENTENLLLLRRTLIYYNIGRVKFYVAILNYHVVMLRL